MIDKIKSTVKDIIRNRVVKVMALIFGTMIIGASLVFYFERGANAEQFESIFHALWWSLVTMTTVGYGDKVPLTTGGRLIGGIIMFSGVALVSMFTATISSIYVARKIREGKGLEKVKYDDHIVLCGWNEQADAIIESLAKMYPAEDLKIVMVSELPEDDVNNLMFKFKDVKLKFVRGDFSNENILELANIKTASSVILVPDYTSNSSSEPDERIILATLVIKGVNTKAKVYAHVINRRTKNHLRRAHVDEIILQDEFTGFLLASHVVNPGIPQAFSELLDYNVRMNLAKMDIPGNFVGMTYLDFSDHVKNKSHSILIGITSEKEPVDIADILTSDPTSLDAFIERKFQESGVDLHDQGGRTVRLNPNDDYVIQKSDQAIIIGEEQN